MVPGMTEPRFPFTKDIVCKECAKEFTVEGSYQHRRQFCFDCRPTVKPYGPSRVDERAYCQLKGCNKRISVYKPKNTKYCTYSHARKAADLKSAEKKKVKDTANALFKQPDQEQRISQERQGETYDKINANPVIK